MATKRCFGSEAAVAVAVAVAVAQSHLTEALRALARSLDRAGAVMVALVVAVVVVDVVVQVMVKLAGQTVSWAAAVGPMEIGIVRDWLSHVIRIAAADDTEDRSGKTVMVPGSSGLVAFFFLLFFHFPFLFFSFLVSLCWFNQFVIPLPTHCVQFSSCVGLPALSHREKIA